ncbi:MAG: alpha/beta hydrolase-fold protein [Lachnospiraceae bacterium]|nr:alpha/beta hydrolase-fold protein [Lachnospiraceae bacterium]
MVNKWDITIPELTGEEVRSAYIYLPESYHYDTERYYPVLYMFDGHNVFFDADATYGKCWGIKEYMDYTNTQMIIVAVECNHGPNNDRLKEYSPFSFRDPQYGKITGKGHITMDWLVNSFKKEIDQAFRTLSDREHTYIAGSSMGGLMSLYALIEYNHIFSKAAALSPSLWTGPNKITQMIKNTSLDPNTTLYMDYGSEEIKTRKNMQTNYAKVSSALFAKGVFLESRIVPNGTHSEGSWEKQVPFFMNTLLYE